MTVLRTFPRPVWHEAGYTDTHFTIMSSHYPASLRIESLLRVVRRFVLAAVILPTFTAVPVLLADTAPSFTSANKCHLSVKALGIPSLLRPLVFRSRRLR